MAWPLPLRLAVPSDVVPSLNVTVPLLSNVTDTGPTVAVNVTGSPNTDVPPVDDVTVVVVVAGVTVCVASLETALAAKLALSPL